MTAAPRRRLGDVAEVNPRADDAISLETEVSFVPMAAVSAETGRMDASATRPYGNARQGFRPFRDGDVLIAKITPSMENGKAAVARALHGGHGVGSTEFHVLRVGPDLDSDYLRYYLSRRSFRGEARQHMTGTAGQLRVPARYLADLMIPVPAMAAQKTAISWLDTELTLLEAGAMSIRKLKTRLAGYLRAVLNHGVGDLRSESRRVQLGDVLLSMRNGMSPKPDADRTGIPILRISAVRPLTVDLSDIRFMNERHIVSDDFYVHDDDLLFTRYNGNSELVGACGMVRGLTSRILHPDKLIRVVARRDLVLPGYLEIAANAGITRAFIRSHAKTTAGQSGISGSDLKRAPLLLPTLAEQAQIVEWVDSCRSVAKQVDRLLDATVHRAAALRESVLERVFSAGDHFDSGESGQW